MKRELKTENVMKIVIKGFKWKKNLSKFDDEFIKKI